VVGVELTLSQADNFQEKDFAIDSLSRLIAFFQRFFWHRSQVKPEKAAPMSLSFLAL
jgi:hypothetical protein